MAQRDQPALPGKTEHEQITRNRIAHQRRGEASRIDEIAVRRDPRPDRLAVDRGGEIDHRIAHECGCRRDPAVDDRHRPRGVEPRQAAGCHDKIAGEQQVGRPGPDPHGIQ